MVVEPSEWVVDFVGIRTLLLAAVLPVAGRDPLYWIERGETEGEAARSQTKGPLVIPQRQLAQEAAALDLRNASLTENPRPWTPATRA